LVVGYYRILGLLLQKRLLWLELKSSNLISQGDGDEEGFFKYVNGSMRGRSYRGDTTGLVVSQTTTKLVKLSRKG